MLKFFKSTLVSIPTISILTILLVSRIILFLNITTSPIDWSSPQSPLIIALKQFPNFEEKIGIQLIISFFIVLFQAKTIEYIVGKLKNKIWKYSLTTWLFILFMHCNESFILLSPQLLSFSFVLLSISVLIQIDDQKKPLKRIFLSSFFIGISSLFWMPSLFFLLVMYYYLYKVNLFNTRTVFLKIIAFSIPWFYAMASMYLFSFENMIQNNLIFNTIPLNNFALLDKLSLLLFIGLMLVSIFTVVKYLKNQIKQITSFFYILLIYFFCFTFLFLFKGNAELAVCLFLALPGSILLNVFFNSFKRSFISEGIHIALLLIIFTNLIKMFY